VGVGAPICGRWCVANHVQLDSSGRACSGLSLGRAPQEHGGGGGNDGGNDDLVIRARYLCVLDVSVAGDVQSQTVGQSVSSSSSRLTTTSGGSPNEVGFEVAEAGAAGALPLGLAVGS
jgi:hypothetical protein